MPRTKKTVVEIAPANAPVQTPVSVDAANTNTNGTENRLGTENGSGMGMGAGVADDLQLSQQYQRKTDKQHILDNPDTYIGSVEKVDAEMWVYQEETKQIQLKTMEYVPGLYKLFEY